MRETLRHRFLESHAVGLRSVLLDDDLAARELVLRVHDDLVEDLLVLLRSNRYIHQHRITCIAALTIPLGCHRIGEGVDTNFSVPLTEGCADRHENMIFGMYRFECT